MTRSTVIGLLLMSKPTICLGGAMHARMDCCMHGRTAGKWHLVEHQATGFVDHEERENGHAGRIAGGTSGRLITGLSTNALARELCSIPSFV